MTLRPTAETLIGDLAVARPASIPILEQLGLDYCCGGNRSLAEAAAAAGRPVDEVLSRLAAAEGDPTARDWSGAPLPELLDHIVATHHEYMKAALPALWEMIGKVVNAHAEGHPELAEVRATMGRLFEELDLHLQKEEQILFPMIRGLCGASGPAATPGSCPGKGTPCAGGPEGPMTVMEQEHDDAGEALRTLRRLTQDYRLPEGACTTFRGLYAGLQELEADLHQHIHLENNLLHRRVRRMLVEQARA
jgi:regulator of cell morphogenesis and NO signaling